MGCVSSHSSDKSKSNLSRKKAGEGDAKSGEWLLKEFRVVWYDPNIDSEENKKHQSYFKEKYGSAAFCSTPEKTAEELKSGYMLVVVVSCGENYQNIKKTVESTGWVSKVFIFSKTPEAFKSLKDSTKKDMIVSSQFQELEEELKKSLKVNPRLERFFSCRDQSTFFTLSKQETINNALTQMVGNEGCSIFFPIGFKGVDISEVLTNERLDKILEVAENDPKIAPSIEGVRYRVEELKGQKSPESIIASYTGNGLYWFLNLYIRYGNFQSFKIFSEYLYCLKGAMIELGIPPSKTSMSTVYRGMSLSASDLKKWTDAANSDKTNQFGLFPCFTSTTLDEKVADGFINEERQKGTQRKLVKVYMEFTDNTEEFCDYLKKFDFIEDCGIIYPADISKYSLSPHEAEVLFPPFYPFKISRIEYKNELNCIYLVVPKQLCFTSSKDPFSKRWISSTSENWAKEFIIKACDLALSGISMNLTFCILIFEICFRPKVCY